MQQLPLILSLLALSTGGFAIMTQPSGAANIETDDMRLKALQAEVAALREDLYNIKNSGGGSPTPPPPMEQDFGKGGGEPSTLAAAPPDESGSMPSAEMPEMPQMDPEMMIPPDPMLAAQIRMVMKQERQKNREQRVGRHLERFAERLNEKLANHEATSGLSEDDRTSLTEILHKERKGMSKLYRGIRSGDMSPKEARQELQSMRADTIAIIRESMGDDLANSVGALSPLPERGPLAPRK